MNLDGIYHQETRNVLLNIQERLFNHLTISPGLAPGGTATNFQLGAFSYLLGGVAYNKAAANNIAAPGVSTGAGEFRKVLICIDSAGTVSTVAGNIAASQAAAAQPDVPANKIGVGVIELPESFASGTTNVTVGMCKPFTHTIA